MVGDRIKGAGKQRERKAREQGNKEAVFPLAAASHGRTSAVYHLLVALVVVVSIVYRMGNLGAFSLSNDEGAYLMWAWLVHSGRPLYSETVSVSAPFFIVALDWAFDLAGVSLITGRALVLGFLGLTLFSLGWAGKLLHHWTTGLMAVLVFSLAPMAFVLSRMAIGEIPAVALATLSLTLASVYWRHGKWGWAALSGFALSLSLLVKAMNPLVAVPVLWFMVARHWHRRTGWPRTAAILVVWGLAGLLPVLVCLLVYEPAALYDQAVVFRFELRAARPWSLVNNMAQLEVFFQQQWGMVGLALAGIVLLAKKARWAILLPLGSWLLGSLITVLFHSPLFAHHAIILLPPLALLAGMGFTETVALLRERSWVWSTPGLAGGLAFLLALPSAMEANQTAQAASFGREAEAIAFLEQITLPTDNIISDNLLLPFMAGRQTPPPLGDLAQVAIDSGRQTSERLIAISEAYPVSAVASWALRLPHLDEYTDWVETNYLVRRVWDDHHIVYFGRRVPEDQIPNRVDAQVGDSIELLGYDLANRDQMIGSSQPEIQGTPQVLGVTLYWRVKTPVKEDYTVFVHLLDPEGQLVTQHDGQPLQGYLPTSKWPVSDVIPDQHALLLPAGLSPGRYQLIAGMYALETLERLPVQVTYPQFSDDSVTLTILGIGSQNIKK